jgi:hypothetical protein
MSSPSIETTKSKIIENIKNNSKNIYIYYPIIVFILLLIIRPKFIIIYKTLNDNKKDIKISKMKLLLWETIFCLPLVFYYIINK